MQLKKFERPIDPDVVVFLEETLAKAKTGEVSGVLLVEQDRQGGVAYSVAGVTNRYMVSGLLFHALHKLQSD